MCVSHGSTVCAFTDGENYTFVLYYFSYVLYMSVSCTWISSYYVVSHLYGRRFKDKKEAVEPEADPERDQRTVFAYQVVRLSVIYD